MKVLNKLLNDAKEIVFVDFEGTQLTQEIIAIGAIKATLDNKKQIKKLSKPFKVFIVPEGVVGPIVEKITGITDLFLFQNGLKFEEAIDRFKKYCGNNLTFTSFVTYGNYDMRLLHQTALINKLDDNDFIHAIYKKHIDFSALLSRYVRSYRNETLSLFDSMKIFEVTPQGDAHDPESDAINLALLYEAFLKEKNILKEEYLKVLLNNPKLPLPIKKLIEKLNENKMVTMDDLSQFVEEDIK